MFPPADSRRAVSITWGLGGHILLCLGWHGRFMHEFHSVAEKFTFILCAYAPIPQSWWQKTEWSEHLSGDVLINVEKFPLGSERFWLGCEFSCSHIAMSEFFIQTHLNMDSFSEACLIKSSMLKSLAFVVFWTLDIIMGCWFPMFIIGAQPTWNITNVIFSIVYLEPREISKSHTVFRFAKTSKVQNLNMN